MCMMSLTTAPDVACVASAPSRYTQYFGPSQFGCGRYSPYTPPPPLITVLLNPVSAPVAETFGPTVTGPLTLPFDSDPFARTNIATLPASVSPRPSNFVRAPVTCTSPT